MQQCVDVTTSVIDPLPVQPRNMQPCQNTSSEHCTSCCTRRQHWFLRQKFNIEHRLIQWLAHVLRMDQDRIPRTALRWTTPERRKQGRPKKTWRRAVMAELNEMSSHEVRHCMLQRIRPVGKNPLTPYIPPGRKITKGISSTDDSPWIVRSIFFLAPNALIPSSLRSSSVRVMKVGKSTWKSETLVWAYTVIPSLSGALAIVQFNKRFANN